MKALEEILAELPPERRTRVEARTAELRAKLEAREEARRARKTAKPASENSKLRRS